MKVEVHCYYWDGLGCCKDNPTFVWHMLLLINQLLRSRCDSEVYQALIQGGGVDGVASHPPQVLSKI